MPYATPQSLVDRVSAIETLAQAAGPVDQPPVSGALLRLTIEGGDRSAYTADEQAAADDALVVLLRALADAESEVNGYLAGRHEVPLATVPDVIVRHTIGIAIYHVIGTRATERDERLYKDAIAFLRDVSRGVVSLGTDGSGDQPATSNTVQFDPGTKHFGRDEGGFL
jgi:phage gp36-like protein